MEHTRQVNIVGAPNPELGPEFQYQVIAHMARDANFFRTNFGWLKADHFSLIECQLILATLYDFYEKYRTLPTLTTMELHLTDVVMPSGIITWTPEDTPQLCALLGHIHMLPRLEGEYYQQKLQQFIREAEVHALMREASTQGFGNQADLMIQGLESIRASNAQRGGIVIDSASAGNPELILTAEQMLRIPTGLRKLDAYMSGGIAPRELGMVTACTGVGKTNALINFQFSCILAGKRALLISTELPISRIKHRYQAMAMGIDANYFKQAVEFWPEKVLYQYQFFLHEQYKFRDREQFVDFSDREPTIPMIEQAICQWKQMILQKYGPEEAAKCLLVCVDWLDYISDTGMGGSNARTDEKLTNKARSLGFVGRRTDTGIWTATQGTREADGKEVLQLKHTSGAYHKNDALDISIGLGRVNEDGGYGDAAGEIAITDDSDDNPPCDRELVTSIMKNRSGSGAGSVSFPFYQGPSLKFWDNKNQMNTAAVRPELQHLYTSNLEDTLNSRRRRV